MNSRGNTLGFLHAVAVSREPHGVLRRDIDHRRADGNRFTHRRAVGRQPTECVLFTFAMRVVSEG